MPIQISGVGVNVTIELEDNASVQDALVEAGFIETEDLDVAVNGAPVADPAETPAQPESSVVATPKKAELG